MPSQQLFDKEKLGFLCLGFLARLLKRVIHSCLQAPEFDETFAVGLVETGFDVVVSEVLVV
jgi:hypothetical protein